VILSPGPHVIRLTVTDSDGNTAIKTIRLSAGYQVFLPTILQGAVGGSGPTGSNVPELIDHFFAGDRVEQRQQSDNNG